MTPRLLFITWYPSCRRSDALAAALGGKSYLIHYGDFKRPIIAPFKYCLQTLVTLYQLCRERPSLVIVASPPVFAILPVWIYCRLARVQYVVDAHTGVFDDARWKWLGSLSRFLSKQAAATIVTNDFLKGLVERWGARAVIVGDVPVDFPALTMDLGAGFHVVVVNTFSQDEPLDAVLSAAAMLPQVRFHVTGNPRHARQTWSATASENVRFTGWLSESEYASLLRGADVIMCLTTRDHTMQRGAYEAMALAKPLITSNWRLLRETFHAGTLHVDNTPKDIAAAVMASRVRAHELAEAMTNLRQQRQGIFEEALCVLRETVASPVTG
jgi:glycosyltransferase involved in cell wall biosynthesis